MASKTLVTKGMKDRARETFGPASEKILGYLEGIEDGRAYDARALVLFTEPITSLFSQLKPDMKYTRAGSIINDAVELAAYDSEMFTRTLNLLDKIFESGSQQKIKELMANLALYHLSTIVGSIKALDMENIDGMRPAYFTALGCMEVGFEQRGENGLFGVMNDIGSLYDASWKEYYRRLRRPLANLTAVVMEQTGMPIEDAELEAKLHIQKSGAPAGPSIARNVRFLESINRLGNRISIR